MKAKIFTVSDIETVKGDDDYYFNSSFYLGGIYDGKDFQYYNNFDDYLNALFKCKIVFFHNLNFDLQVIMKHLDSNKYILSCSVNGSTIINATLKSVNNDVVHFYDSMNIYSMSLEKLEKSFNKQRKTIEIKHDRSNLQNYDLNVVVEYLKEDCIYLYEILDETFTFFGDIKFTMPSLAYNYLLKNYLLEDYHKNKIFVNYHQWLWLSYKGGRCEVFKRFGKNLFYYDVNSLYPYVMFRNVYPLGKPLYTQKYLEGVLGIYHVKVNEYIPIGLSIVSVKDEKLLFIEGKSFEAYLTSIEIEYAKQNSKVFDFEVIKGIYFIEDDYIFKDFIYEMYEKRKQYKKEKNALEVVYKLVMNSCYGKFGEKSEKEVIVFTTNEDFLKQNENKMAMSEGLDCYFRKKINIPVKNNVAIASFITAYARVEITHRANILLKNGYDVYYIDTDSIITNANPNEMSKLNININDSELGAMKLEYEIKEGYFLLPKVYGFLTQENKEVIKAKGFDVKAINYEDIKKIYNSIEFRQKSKRMTKIKSSLKKQKYVYFNDVEKKLLNTVSDKRIYINDDSLTLDRIYEDKSMLDIIELLITKKQSMILDKEFYYYLNRLNFVKDVIDLTYLDEFENLLFNYYENTKEKSYILKKGHMRKRYRKKITKDDIIEFFFDKMIIKENNLNDLLDNIEF